MNMETPVESIKTSENEAPVREWVRIGAVAVASALLGGLAAAWWYRKTLRKMQDRDEICANPEFGIPEEEEKGGD
jgi:hypothetical protein